MRVKKLRVFVSLAEKSHREQDCIARQDATMGNLCGNFVLSLSEKLQRGKS